MNSSLFYHTIICIQIDHSLYLPLNTSVLAYYNLFNVTLPLSTWHWSKLEYKHTHTFVIASNLVPEFYIIYVYILYVYYCMKTTTIIYVCCILPRVVHSSPKKTEMNSHSHMQCCMQQPLSTPTHHLNSMTSGTYHPLHIRYHWEWYIIIQTNYTMNNLYDVHMHWQCIYVH